MKPMYDKQAMIRCLFRNVMPYSFDIPIRNLFINVGSYGKGGRATVKWQTYFKSVIIIYLIKYDDGYPIYPLPCCSLLLS